MLKVYSRKPFLDCINEAFSNNAIITSDGLSCDEFIWVKNGIAYYEDGGRLGCESDTISFLTNSNWVSSYDWYIAGYLTDAESKALNEVNIDLNTKDSLKSILSNVITVKDLVSRANVSMFCEFDDFTVGTLKTYIVSKSDKPITKDESELLTKVYRSCGNSNKLIFLPYPS